MACQGSDIRAKVWPLKTHQNSKEGEEHSIMASRSDLQGKVAIVTGGGRGIGKAIAGRLAEAGASVVIASRKLENLQATAEEFKGHPGRVIAMACHVGRTDQIEKLVSDTEQQLGPVDILVNNSATNIGQGPSLDVTDDMFAKMFELNVVSALRLIRLVVPGMIKRGTGGSIINISSIAGLRPQAGGLLYSATKAALIMMTRTWAIEFGRYNVRVNAIAPGLIQTDFSEYFWKNEEYVKQIETNQPIPRIGTPDEIGGLALYLASDESSFVTGQTFVVDGGATTR
jgi:NAD(P)-dependent dehydrogenase (short-subunit alcohol dehydrogenase family)